MLINNKGYSTSVADNSDFDIYYCTSYFPSSGLLQDAKSTYLYYSNSERYTELKYYIDEIRYWVREDDQ